MKNWLMRLMSMLLIACTLMTGVAIGEGDTAGLTYEEDVMLPDEETAADEDDISDITIGSDAQDALDVLDETVDDTVDPDSLELNTNLPDNVVNILLIGIDSRKQDLDEGDQRADVQIILSINKDSGEITLTSVMRDLYVTIPTRKSKAKINTSFSGTTGGPELSMRTINHNFQMNIQNYVVINFFGLASVIDAVGGVDVELTRAEASSINAYLKANPPKKYYDVEVVPLEKVSGVQHLDGIHALMYARLRHTDDDFHRTERQRNLLELLLRKIMQDMTLDKMASLMEMTLPYVHTNVNSATMLELGLNVLGSGIIEKAQNGESLLGQFRIPMDSVDENGKSTPTWKYGTTDSGASVVMFRTAKRLQENVEALHTLLYGQYYAAP